MVFPRFNTNHFKSIPLKTILLGLLLLAMCVYSLLCIIHPVTRLLYNTKAVRLHNVEIESLGDGVRRAESKVVKIVSSNQAFYFVYPLYSKEYPLFTEMVNKNAQDGHITLDATIATEQTLLDIVRGRYRILSFSVDGREYLSMDTTRCDMTVHCIGVWVAFIVFTVCILIYLFYINAIYSIVVFPKSYKKNN